MNKRFKAAFTLVELLVVIAIVGILSGLIIVGMSSSVNNARIAKAQIFASSLRDSLLSSLVSEWKFDGTGINDGSAVTAGTTYLQDTWSQKNATIGVAPLVYSGSNCVYGSCLSYNGTSQYLTVADDPLFNFGTQMTAMVWAKGGPQSGTYLLSKMDTSKWAWGMAVTAISQDTSTNKFRVLISSDGGTTNYKQYYTNSVVFDNKWHLYGFTFNSGTLTLYVDGVAMTSVTKYADGTCSFLYNSNASIAVGCYFSGTATGFFNGLIDEVRLYNSAVPTSEIREQYYAGLNNLLARKEITPGEYFEKLSLNQD